MSTQSAYYTYVDCSECRIPMVHNKALKIWECKECGYSISEIPPPPTLTDWEKYHANTSVSCLEHISQEVTLRCPAGCGQFISTDWDGCYGCGFKWGDEV